MSEDRIQMTDLPAIHIACPQCGFSNAIAVPNLGYKEAVYQPCSSNDRNRAHNLKAQVKCASCQNDFDFYWCVGHIITSKERK